MDTDSHALPRRPDRVDPHELRRARQLIRTAADGFARVTAEEQWPLRFPPIRYLILAQLDAATAFGLTPRRLARVLAVRPSTLAHHLDVLERADLITRGPRRIHDMRRVSVRLTERGRYAVRRLEAPPPPIAAAGSRPRAADPYLAQGPG